MDYDKKDYEDKDIKQYMIGGLPEDFNALKTWIKNSIGITTIKVSEL